MSERTYDLVAMGRSSIDLYADDIGAPFPEIKSFSAFVGGCPTNVSVAVRRLGLRAALLTAVGDDPVGDFILKFLNDEGVETRFIPRKLGHRTSAVLLGIEPPDRFPLVFYRERCADWQLALADVDAVPWEGVRALLVSGTGLAREPSRSATLHAVERAQAAGARVFLDLDFRADQWHDPRAYGVAIRSALGWVDVAIGTEEEVKAAALPEALEVTIEGSQISSPRVRGDLSRALETLIRFDIEALVLKRGAQGATVYLPEGKVVHADSFPVEVVNVLGAGDAFAGGFIYGVLQGWDWHKAARMGNACGAIVVTRQGCANFMPTIEEVRRFVEEGGGF